MLKTFCSGITASTTYKKDRAAGGTPPVAAAVWTAKERSSRFVVHILFPITDLVSPLADFCRHGRQLLERIVSYHGSINDRMVGTNVRPGYLGRVTSAVAPEQPEPWEAIMDDFESKVVPGV